MSTKKPCRIGFLGAGTVAEMHARAVSACATAELAAVYDPDGQRASALVQRHGGRVCASEEELLSDTSIDAVYVLVPAEHHVRCAESAMKSGKDVLVEKPVAHRVEEIDRLMEISRSTGRQCVPGHNYIHLPEVRRGRELVRSGSLGRVGSLWVLYNMFHSEAVAARYGGVLRAVGVHHAYSLLYLLGRPQSLTATASRVHYEHLECEDQAMVTTRHAGGAVANLWCSFVSDDTTSHPWSVAYKILGTNGGWAFDWNSAGYRDDRGPGWGLACYVESFAAETAHFVNRVLRGSEEPLSNMQDARDALRIIEAAERSLATGRSETLAW